MDLGASKDIFNGMGTVTLNILDLFNSRKNRSIVEGVNFYSEANGQFRRRQVNLTLTYRIRQAKAATKILEPTE
jgi:hypothetical protein